MSIYFVFCVSKQPRSLNIIVKDKKLELQELHNNFLPVFAYKSNKQKYYFVDDEINYQKIKQTTSDNFTKAFLCKFQLDRNNMFNAIIKWAEIELSYGNSISLVKQVETNNQEESEEYNMIYEKRYFCLKNVNGSENINFDFNIEYELIE